MYINILENCLKIKIKWRRKYYKKVDTNLLEIDGRPLLTGHCPRCVVSLWLWGGSIYCCVLIFFFRGVGLKQERLLFAGWLSVLDLLHNGFWIRWKMEGEVDDIWWGSCYRDGLWRLTEIVREIDWWFNQIKYLSIFESSRVDASVVVHLGFHHHRLVVCRPAGSCYLNESNKKTQLLHINDLKFFKRDTIEEKKHKSISDIYIHSMKEKHK